MNLQLLAPPKNKGVHSHGDDMQAANPFSPATQGRQGVTIAWPVSTIGSCLAHDMLVAKFLGAGHASACKLSRSFVAKGQSVANF